MYQVKFGKKKKSKPSANIPMPESTEANEFGRYVRYGRRSLFGKRRRSRIGTYDKMKMPPTMFGRRSLFGLQYFGANYPQFGKKKKAPSPDLVAASQNGAGTYGSYGFGRTRFGNQCSGAPFKPEGMGMFGRRRRGGLRRRRGGLRRRRSKRMMFGRRRGGSLRRRYRRRRSGLRRRGGRKGSRKTGRKNKKPPAKYLNKAKRLGVKVTRKVGKRRVFKSVKDLKRQIARKKRLQKKKKGGRRTRRRSSKRFSMFGLTF